MSGETNEEANRGSSGQAGQREEIAPADQIEAAEQVELQQSVDAQEQAFADQEAHNTADLAKREKQREAVEAMIMKKAQQASNVKIKAKSQVSVANLLECRIVRLFDLQAFDQLRRLFVINCGLRTVEIQHLQFLEEADFGHNQLLEVPVIHSRALLKLNVQDNAITDLRLNEFCRNLTLLNVSGNAIAQGDVLVDFCPRLQTLQCSNCKLKGLQICMELRQLRTLEARENDIESLEAVEDYLSPSLRVVELQKNVVSQNQKCFELCCAKCQNLQQFNGRQYSETQVAFSASKYAKRRKGEL